MGRWPVETVMQCGTLSAWKVGCTDRFGRNDTEALRAIDELHEFGVAVHFANSPDLDAWLRFYNIERPHQGYRNMGRRPYDTVQLYLQSVTIEG